MIKISVVIAYEQNRPKGVASALRAQFGFWVKSALKMHCTKKIFGQKLLQITIPNFWCKNVFDLPTGGASALISQFSFFGEKCLKNALYKIVLPDKSCYKSKFATFMLCNFFDILHHYGIITASQICSVCRESIVPSYGTDFIFLPLA